MGYGLYRPCQFSGSPRSPLSPSCISPELLSPESMGIKLKPIKTRVSLQIWQKKRKNRWQRWNLLVVILESLLFWGRGVKFLCRYKIREKGRGDSLLFYSFVVIKGSDTIVNPHSLWWWFYNNDEMWAVRAVLVGWWPQSWGWVLFGIRNISLEAVLFLSLSLSLFAVILFVFIWNKWYALVQLEEEKEKRGGTYGWSQGILG